MYRWLIFACFVILYSCSENDSIPLNEDILSEYIELNSTQERDFLIACAAGKEGGMHDNPENPTAIYFYPVEGATDYRYFETTNISDSLDFEKYQRVNLSLDPVFNGYLQRWNRSNFEGERMAIVTYITQGTLHISDPIRIKTNTKSTEVNPDLVDIELQDSLVDFEWQDGLIDENVIYFQVISNEQGDLISGTYTYDRSWTFYDTSNVVLNITNTEHPELISGNNYTFTMMAVSDDNWVNLLIQKPFLY